MFFFLFMGSIFRKRILQKVLINWIGPKRNRKKEMKKFLCFNFQILVLWKKNSFYHHFISSNLNSTFVSFILSFYLSVIKVFFPKTMAKWENQSFWLLKLHFIFYLYRNGYMRITINNIQWYYVDRWKKIDYWLLQTIFVRNT